MPWIRPLLKVTFCLQYKTGRLRLKIFNKQVAVLYPWDAEPFSFYIGVSPSGKAQDFDSCIPMVRIHLPQPCTETVQVQSADCVGEGSEAGLLWKEL